MSTTELEDARKLATFCRKSIVGNLIRKYVAALLIVESALSSTEQHRDELQKSVDFLDAQATKLLQERDSLKALNAELVEALTPFANCNVHIASVEDDEEWAKFRLLIKDYRRAAAVMAKVILDKVGMT